MAARSFGAGKLGRGHTWVGEVRLRPWKGAEMAAASADISYHPSLDGQPDMLKSRVKEVHSL